MLGQSQKVITDVFRLGSSSIAASTCASMFTLFAPSTSRFQSTPTSRTFSSEAPSSSSSSSSPPPPPSPPHILVFGGNGFVGTRVCENALNMGAQVTSINRSGRPASLTAPWADHVQWVRGDALDANQPWRELLKDKSITGIVSTLGTFGSNELMYKICGQANINLIEAAAEEGVPRFAFISVHDYKFPGGWHAQDFLLKGYFKGKRDAEEKLKELYPTGGVYLKPGFIYGNRKAGSMTVPLGLIGSPLAGAMNMLPSKTLAEIPIIGAAFVPPVKVEAVGKAAARAVLDDGIPSGPMDVWTIARVGR